MHNIPLVWDAPKAARPTAVRWVSLMVDMIKEEFIKNKNEAEKNAKIIGMVQTIGILIFLIANIPLSKYVPKRYEYLFLIILFGFLFGNLGFLFWMERRRTKKYNLLCPECKKPLTNIAGQLAVATGNCCHCGSSLWS